MHPFSRRSLLKTGAAFAATFAAPSLVRAAPKEIVISGPAGAAKYFNADLFPVLEKKLDCKVLYEGTNSLTNLQKMQADKASPKISVVIMDDPVMLPAAAEGLITKMSSSAIPNLGKLVDDAVHQDGMWANYQKPWVGIAYSTKRMKTAPVSWAELWDAKYDSKIVVPSLSNTEGFWTLLAAAHLGGVSEIYRVGGAQAVAALAHGTATIAPVVKIVGPGNAYVAAAKRLVFGKVGIDMIAGPSEVLVIADDSGNADWIAADLLAQAEHDASAQSILITDSRRLADDVARAVEGQLKTLPRAQIAGASWADFGAIIEVDDLDQAVPLADAIAAEHLEIMTRDPDAFAARVRNAGAIFLGAHTPEAIGDYVGGSNHVLPTARSARFSSGLGVLDFMKRTSLLKCGPEQLRALGPAAMTLGKAEGLDAHSRSVGIRLNLP
ncbi:MAG: histidinol dehydrogenase [Bradyrhizobium sp.]|nr:histidinol dehydrogenase [Bradyrhizobium sp.]